MKCTSEGDKKFPCLRSTCWSEMISWFRLAKQRKKRKKREKISIIHREDNKRSNYIQCAHSILIPMPRIMLLSLLVLPILVLLLSSSSFDSMKMSIKVVHSQLIVDHPSKSQVAHTSRDYLKMLNLLPIHEPINLTAISEDHTQNKSKLELDNELPLLHPWKLREFRDSESIANYSTLPTSKAKQNELLRKLSSTMLLETLLRHPFPTNISPIPLPNMLKEPPPYNLKLDGKEHSLTRRLAPNAKRTSMIKPMNTRNEGMTKEWYEQADELSSSSVKNKLNESDNFTLGKEIFNASSLNYLVEKLLNTKSIKQNDNVDDHRPRSRPANRAHVANLNHSSLSTTRDPILPYHLRNLKNTQLTLDMLIKDEYDSRVKPMYKSLLDQQRISASSRGQSFKMNPNITTSKVPVNHKLEITQSIETTTMSPIEDRIEQGASPSIMVTSPTMTSTNQMITTESDEPDTLIAFENFDDNEEADDEDEDNEVKKQNFQSDELVQPKKPPQIVPPYQLSGSEFGYHSDRPKPPKLNMPEIQITTTRLPAQGKMKRIEQNDGSRGEKTADASTRGTLVFSDGAVEAQRANKRRVQNKNTGSRANQDTNSGGRRKETNASRRNNIKDASPDFGESSGRVRESFLLNQLFSTANPLSELSHRLREHHVNKDSSIRNPLIYKGYVGSDDNILLANGGDWSRPLGNGEDILAPQTVLRRPTSKLSDHLLTTPAPPTEPPTTPYSSYFLNNQPVTNAQAVPTLVIPTSDPPQIVTTLSPKYSIQFPRNDSSIDPFLYNKAIFRFPQKPPDERRYSYQLPDRPPNRNRTQFSAQNIPAIENNANSTTTIPKSPNELDAVWSPSKIYSSEVSTAPNIQKRKQLSAAHNIDNSAASLNVTSNFSSPMNVSSEAAVFPNTNNSRISSVRQGDIDSESINNDPSTFTSRAPKVRVPVNNDQLNNRRDFGHDSGENQGEFSHGDHKMNFPRSRSKIHHPAIGRNSTRLGGLFGDTESELDQIENSSKVKSPSGPHTYSNNNRRPENDAGSEDYEDQYEGEDSSLDGNEVNEQGKQKVLMNKRFRERMRFTGGEQHSPRLNNNQQGNRTMYRNNNTRKAMSSENHEQAGSEIQLTGLPDNRKFNLTSRMRQHQLGSGRVGEIEPSSFSRPTLSSTSVASSNPNFYGDASSGSANVESSQISLSNQGKNINLLDGLSHLSTEDPFARGGLVSTSSSTTTSTSTTLPSVSNTRSAQQATGSTTTPATVAITKQQDESSAATGAPGNSKSAPSASKSNDRLAFILIGGSCALSVVCLVLAAMSMRCQDMCDDYRSLRNAERAALKLQKHRLKYTKKHQINRLNHASGNIEHSLLDELNNLQQQNAGSLLDPAVSSSEIANLGRSSKCLNASQGAIHDQTDWNTNNNVNCQLPLSAFITKEPRNGDCRCRNCAGHGRWLCQDNMLTSKHISWLHPQYYGVQQQAPALRPLFGAGSSVGTFFPHRVDESAGAATAGVAGSLGAQTLMDSQPSQVSHNCGAQVTRSKSILQQSKRMCQPGKSAANGYLDLNCELPNFGCNNPEHHEHSHHICAARYLMAEGDSSAGTSGEESGKLALNESALQHCHSSKCSGNHQHHTHHNNRLKLTQLKANATSQQHNHHHTSTDWKVLGSLRKGNSSSQHQHQHPHLHHHHHHQHHNERHRHNHHQPVLSSSDSSSIAQCTCSHDNQPLIASKSGHRVQNHHRSSYKHQQHRVSSSQQAKRDKAMLIWSTNRDRLI